MVVWAVTSAALVVIVGWMGLTPRHLRAPGQVPGRMAGDGAPPRPGPRRRRVVPLVVRAGPRRGRRRVGVHSRLPRRHPRRPSEGTAGDFSHRSPGGERRHGPAPCPALPRLRLLRVVRDRADDPATGPNRHPAGPGPHRHWGCGFCPTRRAGDANGCACS